MLEKLDNIVSGDNTDGNIAFIDHFGLVVDEEEKTWGSREFYCISYVCLGIEIFLKIFIVPAFVM